MNIPVLSYTVLNDYRVCPKRFFHKYIAKDTPKEIKTGEQKFGTNVHEALRKRINLREPLPEEFQKHEKLCEEIEAAPGVRYAEVKLGIDSSGHACDFFAPGVWLRGALDLVITNALSPAVKETAAVLLDWKTGKVWEDPFELAIQALLLRARYPDIQSIVGHYVWLRDNRLGAMHDVNDTEKIFRDVKGTASRITMRLASNDWPPDEGSLCPWCPVGKDQCQFRKDNPR